MSVNRIRTPLTLTHYMSIQGKIVSRELGIARRFIQDKFSIVNGKFVLKNKLKDVIDSKKAPKGIASEDPNENSEEFKNYLCTNLGFIQENTALLGDSGSIEPTKFNDLQAFLMNSEHFFLWTKKSRQFGFSLVMAARALAKAMIKTKHTSIFVSYNEEESKEKIIYARELYESLPMKWKLFRKLKYDNKTSLVLDKSGQNTVETRILSYPQRIIRGKGGEIDIGLDEAPHCIHIRKIYTSALPALSRSKTSTLWLGGSPTGKSGLFYEIGINMDNIYSSYIRLNLPWWVISEFSKDVKTSRKVAWDMHTGERVGLFAKDKIKIIFNNMVIDDFQQEYECAELDEQYSYFPWDLINSCVPIFDVDGDNVPAYDAAAGDLSHNDISKSGIGIEHFNNFEDFMNAIHAGIIKGAILGGFDVGRTTDASEIYYVEEHPNTYRQIARCSITMKNVSLPEQRRIVKEQFEILGSKLIRFGVDYNGIGRNIAEDLEEISYEKVEKLNFNSNSWKEEACREFKYRMSKQGIEFSTDRSVLNQIHSIKRILLPGGIWRFDAEKAKKHHGDKFWALLGASIVGHTIEGDYECTQFDDRVISPKNLANQTQPASVMLTANSMANVMKYNPWGAAMPMLPVAPSLQMQSSNSFESGLVSMDNELPFKRN